MDQQKFTFTCVGVGLLIVFAFLLWCVRKSARPQLATAIMLFLRGVGLMFGFDLGYIILTALPQELGVLNGRQIPILVGSMAILWVSVEGIIDTFRAIGENGNISREM